MTRQIFRHTRLTSCRVGHDTTKLSFNFGFVTPFSLIVHFLFKICTFVIRRFPILITLTCSACFSSYTGFVACNCTKNNYVGTPIEGKNEVNVTWGMTKNYFYNYCET